MSFKGPVLMAAIDAMLDAFPTRDALAQLLEFRLEKQLDAIVGDGGLKDVLFKVFKYANAEGWETDLIRAGRSSNPNNAKLMQFATTNGAAVAVDQQLEKWVNQQNAMLDLPSWLARLGQIERRVCRVEAGNEYGTGYLVAPDLVLTNCHVVANQANVAARFDYRRLDTATSAGTLVDVTATVSSSPIPDLDYALLRLATALGNMPIGNAEPGAAKRGWLVPTASTFVPNSPIFIVQHPKADPISLALDTSGMIGIGEKDTRVRYKTNTDPGSSGSPCFDQQWNLIAMHRSGDPAYKPATYNEGIPIMKIVENLKAVGIQLP